MPAPLPPSGTGSRGHPVHRDLGQGQGRGDLVGDDGDRPRRHAAVDAEAVDLRPRRGRLRRRARPVDVGPSRPTAHPISSSPCRRCRSRRCCTGCAATATRCTPTRVRRGRRLSRADPARPVHLRHDLQGASSTPCSTATRPPSAPTAPGSPASCSPARRCKVSIWKGRRLFRGKRCRAFARQRRRAQRRTAGTHRGAVSRRRRPTIVGHLCRSCN